MLFSETVTVLLPLEYTAGLAMLMFGSISGTVPFTVQYSGRHISQMKVKLLKTELLAVGTTGKIQFGEVPGCMAQVIVPAFPEGVPAAGTEPIAPATLVTPFWLLPPLLLLLLLLQAASAVMLATAMAIPPMVLVRNFIIAPPSSRCSRL